MISVLTMTYQRQKLLEEAIESFLRQNIKNDYEMVIINDCDSVKYISDNPLVSVINLDKRFSSAGAKLEYGFSQCKNKYIYRLDDDDLLAPRALEIVAAAIFANPGYEIYRSNGCYSFVNNKYIDITSNVNNGNVFTKDYISRIKIADKSFGEDYNMIFEQNAKIYTIDDPQKTMIYRWGMNTYHLSGMGDIGAEEHNKRTDAIVSNTPLKNKPDSGLRQLKPGFKNDYYAMLPQ